MSTFENDIMFANFEEVMEWVQTTVRHFGYVIVKQRTKKNVLGFVKKSYLMCDRSGTYKSTSKSKTYYGIYLRFLNKFYIYIFYISIYLEVLNKYIFTFQIYCQ